MTINSVLSASHRIMIDHPWQRGGVIDDLPDPRSDRCNSPAGLRESLRLNATRPGCVRLMTSTSHTLLQRVRRRDDQAAWDQFVTLYSPLLFHWGARAGLSEQDSVDFVQEVFAKLLVELPRFEYDAGRGTFRAWLKTVAVRLCHERRRKRQLPTARAGDAPPLDELAGANGLEEFWEADYRAHVVRQALDLMQAQFEPRLWQCCWGLAVEGRSAADLAAELGMSEGAVYVAKFRVLRSLRRELADLIA
jgi:RNA polymerase sigma-70 factor (ECF subfamily)